MAQVNASFNDRLNRIAAQKIQASGRMRLHVGEQEVLVRSLHNLRPQESRAMALLRNLGHVFGFVAAFALGMLSYAVAISVRMQLQTADPLPVAPAGVEPNALLGGVLGLVVSLGLAQIFRLRSKEYGVAQAAGVFLALMSLHNLAFWVPDLAATLFTPGWVEMTQASAVPDSLIYRGLIVPLHA